MPSIGLLFQIFLKHGQFSWSATQLNRAAIQDRDAGRIIAPVLQAMQSIDKYSRCCLIPDIADYAAHISLLHFFDRGTEPCKNSPGDDGKSDIEFLHAGQPRDGYHILVIQAMPGMQMKLQLDRQFRRR